MHLLTLRLGFSHLHWVIDWWFGGWPFLLLFGSFGGAGIGLFLRKKDSMRTDATNYADSIWCGG